MWHIIETEKVDPSEVTSELKTGNLKTFEMIFNQYYQPLVQYGNTIMKDRDEAEDLVQQVFISVWEKRENIEVHTSLRALLYKAVHNACLNRIKQQKVRREHISSPELAQPAHVHTDPLQEKELEHRIEAAISLLPEQCAKIFRLSRFEQLKYQEIADKLGLSVKTIENQMGKALKLMRESLREYLPLLILFFTTYHGR